MKLLVLILSVLFTISCQNNIENEKLENPAEVPTTESFVDIYLDMKKACMEKVILSSDVLEEINYGITSESVIVALNSEYTDYLSCYWKAKKLQGENGKINFTELQKIINYAVKITIDASDVPLLNTWLIAADVLEKCKSIQGKTHGEKAVNMRNCLFGELLQQRSSQMKWDEFEDIPNLDLIEEDCVNELKLDGLTIEDINRHYVVPENISDFNEFLACYWKRIEIMDKDGNFNNSALLLRFDKAVENEILSRSRVVYLSDIITESILNGCRGIKGNNDGELVLKVQNYILKRLPYFKMLI